MERQTAVKAPTQVTRVNHVQRQTAGPVSNVHPILDLQRSLGNQAVQRLINSPYVQTKLQISTPGDPFEQEADRTADSVMRMAEPEGLETSDNGVQAHTISGPQITALQRAPDPVPEQEMKDCKCSEIQRMPAEGEDDQHEENVSVLRENSEPVAATDPEKKVEEEKQTQAQVQREAVVEADRSTALGSSLAATETGIALQREVARSEEKDTELVSAKRTPSIPVAVREDDEEEKVAPKLDEPSTQPLVAESVTPPSATTDLSIRRQMKDEDDVANETMMPAAAEHQESDTDQRIQTSFAHANDFSTQTDSPIGSTPIGIQRVCTDCNKEKQEEEDHTGQPVQREPSASEPAETVQAKPSSDMPLRRQSSDDEKLESTEASAPPIQKQTEDEDKEKLESRPDVVQRSSWPIMSSNTPTLVNPIQRLCNTCEFENEKHNGQSRQNLSRLVAPTTVGREKLNSSLATTINSLKGQGQPLSPATRAFFEPRFGADFSQVRIHNDTRAADTAGAVRAKAFTVGNDIAFASGQYSPESQEGRRLLAHELTHTLQQSGGLSPHVRYVRKSPVEHDLMVQRQPTPAPAGPVTPPSPPPPGTPPPAPKETDTGLVYITIPKWTLMDKKKKTLKAMEWKSPDITLLKIPVPELGATADLSFEASLAAQLTGEIGPIILADLTLGMTTLTAAVIGGTLVLVAATGPPALGLLIAALQTSYITGFGELCGSGSISAEISAEAKLKGGLNLLGSQKFELAGVAATLGGVLKAALKGVACGRTQVTLDKGHLTWQKAAILSAGAELEASLKGGLEARVLFGLFKARLEKEWLIANPKWAGATTKLLGDMKLIYDWPFFKDEDHILTVREETIKAVAKFIQDLLAEDKDPKVNAHDKQKLEQAGPDTRTTAEKQAAIDKAMAESEAELSKPDATVACVEGKLYAIKSANRLTSLTLVAAANDQFFVEGVINPIGNTKRHKLKKEPAVCPGVPGEPKKDPAAELSLAKSTFKKRHWVRRELEDLLKCGETYAKERIRAWIDANELFALETSPTDPYKAYNFDKDKGGERPLKDTEDNREKYGFKNPGHDSAEGQEILAKGHRPGSPPTTSLKSRYDSMRGGKRAKAPSKFVNFPRPLARLGHGPVGASEFWNEGKPVPGHKQTKAENRKWNFNPDHYWGPEHKEESEASGASSPRYRVPMKAIGSHPDWWS